MFRDMGAVSGALQRMSGSWFHPRALWDESIDQFLFYRVIIVYLRRRIDEFSGDLLGSFTSIVALAALSVLTLWVLTQGYRMVTGQSRGSMMVLVLNAAKATLIVSIALSLGMTGSYWNKLFSEKLPNAITQLVTSSSESPEEQIDKSLAWMQVAFKAIDAVDVSGDQVASDEKDRALLMAAIGSGGPAVVAGSMLLLYQVAIALFTGLGPLFVLCLLFEQTKQLFQRWLFYGIGTMFSMAVLAVMVSIAMDMVVGVAKATWEIAIGNQLLGTNFESGLTSNAMQQGGMGLILTTLILTAPPMAAMFFQGTLGGFNPFSQIGSASNVGPRPGPQGQPPLSYFPQPMAREASTNVNPADYTHQNRIATGANTASTVPDVGRFGVANSPGSHMGPPIGAQRATGAASPWISTMLPAWTANSTQQWVSASMPAPVGVAAGEAAGMLPASSAGSQPQPILDSGTPGSIASASSSAPANSATVIGPGSRGMANNKNGT